MKKIISCLLTIGMLLSFCGTSIAFASPLKTDDAKVYDGITYGGDVTIEQIDSLTESQKEVLRQDDDVLISIKEETDTLGNSSSDISTRSVISSDNISSTLTVKRNSDGSRLTFSLFVDWINLPVEFMDDLIALNWAGGEALMSDACYIKNDSTGSGYMSSSRCQKEKVVPNQAIAYSLNTASGDRGFLLQATIQNTDNGSNYKNVVGGYAHKRWGITDISVSFGYETISFSAGITTGFDEMEPVYTVYI